MLNFIEIKKNKELFENQTFTLDEITKLKNLYIP